MQFYEKILIYLISQVFLPGLFKIFWPTVAISNKYNVVGIEIICNYNPDPSEHRKKYLHKLREITSRLTSSFKSIILKYHPTSVGSTVFLNGCF